MNVEVVSMLCCVVLCAVELMVCSNVVCRVQSAVFFLAQLIPHQHQIFTVLGIIVLQLLST